MLLLINVRPVSEVNWFRLHLVSGLKRTRSNEVRNCSSWICCTETILLKSGSFLALHSFPPCSSKLINLESAVLKMYKGWHPPPSFSIKGCSKLILPRDQGRQQPRRLGGLFSFYWTCCNQPVLLPPQLESALNNYAPQAAAHEIAWGHHSRGPGCSLRAASEVLP
ncbi:hypothetical protein V6N13_143550 [Hibiscus sabdariffa]